MAFNGEKYDFEKLLDDIKLISKSIKIVREENNPENRKFACGLTEDLVTRLFRDMKEIFNLQSKSFGGTIND